MYTERPAATISTGSCWWPQDEGGDPTSAARHLHRQDSRHPMAAAGQRLGPDSQGAIPSRQDSRLLPLTERHSGERQYLSRRDDGTTHLIPSPP